MIFSDITIIDENFAVREHQFVGVKDGRVAYVGAAEPKEDFGSVYSGKGKLLMPAFYNAHTHSAMTLLRGYAENMNLQDWLNTKIFPFEAKMVGSDIYTGVKLAMAESIRSGIVSSTDMYYWLDDAGRAVAEAGCKMNLSNAVLCFDDSSFEDLPAYQIACDAYKNWHGAADGRILTDLALHGEYTSTEKVARGLAALAKEQGVHLHIHAAETKSEAAECKVRRGGRTDIEYLADCGLPKERTYVTGSPMAEVLHMNLEKIQASNVHAKLGLEKGKYILLSAHREENIDTEKNFLSLFTAINQMAEKYDMPILYSCHPRSRKRLEASGFELDKRVIQHEPLGFHDYNCLQMNAFAVVSDSGTLPEESSFFTSIGNPFPAVCIRTSTERPEALDKGCFIISGIDTKGLLQAVDTAVEMVKNGDNGIPVPDYVDENVSDKVVKIIQSYTNIVNRMVWRKDI